MNTLKSTHPHFVRCIIPNEVKTGGSQKNSTFIIYINMQNFIYK